MHEMHNCYAIITLPNINSFVLESAEQILKLII
jgi:hypothetical protein